MTASRRLFTTEPRPRPLAMPRFTIQIEFVPGPLCPWLRVFLNASETAEDLQTMSFEHAKHCRYCQKERQVA
jgi:hypothetical protein